MTSRPHGYKYDATLTNKAIAAKIRADYKALQSAGMLPTDWKISVRYRSFAGGSAIDVTATSPRPTHIMPTGYVCAAPGKHRSVMVPLRFNDDEPARIVALTIRPGERHEIRHRDTITEEAEAVRRALEEVHNAYNHNNSDSMTDYFDQKFYGTVSLDVAEGVSRYERQAPSYLPGGATC